MKTAKKVLSVILAVMLVIGTVSVAVSAVDPGDGQYAKWTLKAEVMDSSFSATLNGIGCEEAQKTISTTNKNAQKAEITAYSNLEEHTYVDTSKTISVKPGQAVWVTVNAQTFGNLYPILVLNHLYYTAGVFLSPCTTASYALNPDSIFFSEGYVQDITFQTWALATSKNRTSTYSHAAGQDVTKLRWIYFQSEINYEEFGPDVFAENLNEDLYSFPLYVDPDAAFGATGQVFMGVDKTNNNSIAGFGGEDFEADLIATQYSFDDLDDAVLNFIVGDFSALDAQIAAFEALTETDWTADTWAAAKTAYTAAKTAKTDATTQEAVDTAATNLKNAIAALEEASATPTLDYTRIDAALLAADDVDTSNATMSSASAFDNAVDAAVAAKATATTQEDLDDAAEALEDAIDGLKDKADMTPIIDALAYADDLDKSDWADETFDELDELVADAQAILAQADDFSDQAAVDAAAQAIRDMTITVECADYNEVWDLMDEASFLNENNYTTASWAALQTALGAVVPSLGKSQQARVDGFAADISNALDGLKEKIDTAGLAAALSIADGENKEDYTTQDWMQLQVYVNAAKNDYIGKEANYAADDKQAEVDQLANDIYDILAKKLGDADYSAVNAIAGQIPDDLSAYTDESVDALIEVYSSIVWDLKSNNQAIVDGYATALEEAFNGLELKKADLTALNAAIAATSTVAAQSNYTTDTWATYAAALKNAQDLVAAAPVLAEQDNVNAAAAALTAAQAALALKDADYSDLDMLKIDDSKADEYTTATWEAYKAALDKVEYGKKIDEQAAVNAMIDEVFDAYAALKKAKAADYSAVNAQIEAFGKIETDLYTEDSVKDVEDAIANVTEGLNENHQAEVDAMAAAIETAIKALVEKTYDPADYTAVDAAIADFNTKDQTLYTADSVNAVKEAIAKVERGLDERSQAAVDKMATDIEDAIKALELLPEPKGVVTDVTYTETASINKTYAVKVEGRQVKIQFINDTTGNTLTFARTQADIVSYNAAGEECNELSRDVAYEIWTIDLSIKDGAYTVIARTVENNAWETKDLGYKLNVVSSTKDAAIVSIVPAADSVAVNGQIPLTVTTGKDVLKIQIYDNGSGARVKTFDASEYATAEGDQLVWNVFVKIYTAESHDLTVNVRTADGWAIDDNATATVTGTKTAVVVK